MKGTRHFLRMTALALTLCAPADAQNRELLGEFKIGIVGRDREDAIYQAAHLGALEAARDLSKQHSIDVELLVLTPSSNDRSGQPGSIGKLFIEDADGFLISPEGDSEILPALEFAREQGQEIVLFESTVTGIDPLASIRADERAAGRMAGERLLRKLPTKGRAAILISKNADANMQARLEGARDALGYRRIEKVFETEPDYFAAIETLRQAMEEDRNDQIKAWLLLGDWPLLGMPALPWKPRELPCVVVQSSPSAFIYLDQGYLDALVIHRYYDWGYRGVEILVNRLFSEESPENSAILTEPQLVDWSNVDEYRENWKRWLR